MSRAQLARVAEVVTTKPPSGLSGSVGQQQQAAALQQQLLQQLQMRRAAQYGARGGEPPGRIVVTATWGSVGYAHCTVSARHDSHRAALLCELFAHPERRGLCLGCWLALKRGHVCCHGYTRPHRLM